jgi:DNA adenine methylase
MSNEFVLSGKSPLSWIGGKSLLAEKIVPRLPEHQCYAEVFGGAAWVLFRKTESKSEIINDINVELVTLYRVIQHHLEEFVRYFKWMLVSRDEFERLRRVEPQTLTDIQRSARFYYLVKTSYGSWMKNPTFGTATTGRPCLNLLRIEEELSEAHLRLSRVLIERLPYADFITRYDRPYTVFYVDPPYFQCEDYYGDGIFERADFVRLTELLGRIEGRFILSINDAPQIREWFSAFRIEEVKTRYSVGKGTKGQSVKELLIMNYEPPRP